MKNMKKIDPKKARAHAAMAMKSAVTAGAPASHARAMESNAAYKKMGAKYVDPEPMKAAKEEAKHGEEVKFAALEKSMEAQPMKEAMSPKDRARNKMPTAGDMFERKAAAMDDYAHIAKLKKDAAYDAKKDKYKGGK